MSSYFSPQINFITALPKLRHELTFPMFLFSHKISRRYPPKLGRSTMYPNYLLCLDFLCEIKLLTFPDHIIADQSTKISTKLTATFLKDLKRNMQYYTLLERPKFINYCTLKIDYAIIYGLRWCSGQTTRLSPLRFRVRSPVRWTRTQSSCEAEYIT